MFENILDEKRLSLLKSLIALDALNAFYLAGGTALSLQLGLRVSVDFDFFTPRHFNADALCGVLRAHFPSTRVIVLEPDTCDLLIEDVRVSFFGSSRKLVGFPPHQSPAVTASPQGEAFQCQAFPLRGAAAPGKQSGGLFSARPGRQAPGRCPEGADEVSVIPQENVKSRFFCYPYPLVEALVPGTDALKNLRVAGPSDIAAMKLSAIGSRGARKDFYDLYQIYHCVPGFDGKWLITATRAKFGQEKDLTYMLMGLGFFDDADQEALPQTFVQADWNEIKRFFLAEQRRLFDEEEARARTKMT